MVLGFRYGVSGTDIGYSLTRTDIRYGPMAAVWPAVLSLGMLLPGYNAAFVRDAAPRTLPQGPPGLCAYAMRYTRTRQARPVLRRRMCYADRTVGARY
eukprot:522112-Rhodomonas_salina.1